MDQLRRNIGKLITKKEAIFSKNFVIQIFYIINLIKTFYNLEINQIFYIFLNVLTRLF